MSLLRLNPFGYKDYPAVTSLAYMRMGNWILTEVSHLAVGQTALFTRLLLIPQEEC